MKLHTGFLLLALGAGHLCAAPAWLVHIQWQSGQWQLISQEKIDADVKLPRTAYGQAEQFNGFRIELVDANSKVVLAQQLTEPGVVEGHFSDAHIETASAVSDYFFTLPSTGDGETLRIVEKNALSTPAIGGGAVPVDQVQASFKLGAAK